MVVEISAYFRGDGETGRHRQTDASHLVEIRAFAAEQWFHRTIAVGFFVAPGINVLNGFGCFCHKKMGVNFVRNEWKK
jgi:hypothetical protein